ncbi:GNAT family N-acetyltransferase, partial [Pleomorphomonas sp. JP5]|uniref:GNAT family N-acetyltransferase n=1 Tax=Pleomorphomonas sp. JP5 TaxID=2942998 RepID=UPI002043147A
MKDAPKLVEAMNDWNTAQWLPTVPFPYRLEDATSFISENARTTPPQAYAITSRESDEFMGVIGLVGRPVAELGYWLLPRHRGLGLICEAVEQLIAVRDTSLAAIFATVDRGNTPSMKVLDDVAPRNYPVLSSFLALVFSLRTAVSGVGAEP